MKILIVDDHVLFRQGLVSLLHSEPDFEICGQAGTVAEAIELARAMHPDMVLMDYSLPDGKGPEAAQSILIDNPKCAVVFLSVNANDEELFAAIRSGAKGYLLKDMPITMLIEKLRAVQGGEVAFSPTLAGRVLAEFARLSPGPGKQHDAFSLLTPRELEVLHEIARGSTNREIADKLFMAENTVKRHVHSILEKLDLPNRRSAANWAREHGLG